MSKDIVKTLSNIYTDIKLKLPTTKLEVGKVTYISHKDRTLFHLITKSQFFHKPQYNDIRQAIHNLRVLATKLGIQNIAIPTISSGINKCDWKMVKYRIIRAQI